YRNLGAFLGDVIRADSQNEVTDNLRTIRNMEQRATGMSEGIPADGGWLVEKQFSDELMKLTHDTGILAARCRRIPIGANFNGLKMNAIDETSRATGSRWGGIRGYWVAEAGTKTASQTKIRRMEIELAKLAGLFYLTDELKNDQTALESIFTQGFAEEFAFLIDDAIYSGDGVGKPAGILESDALVSVAKEVGQSSDTFVAENAFAMWARLWPRSMANAVWYINQSLYPELFKMHLAVGTGGSPVYLPGGNIAGAPFGSLLGRPVQPIEQASALGDVGDCLLADLSQYVLIDKGGIESAVSIHVKFVEDETAFRVVTRVNGQSMWASVLTPFKGSDTVSPFVTLAERA
ncbi:MAG: phage major capsid protein, partial [Acidimicrobiia bacterium]|nr:phage major capsid protein [Acidimicrobiia bacterium]